MNEQVQVPTTPSMPAQVLKKSSRSSAVKQNPYKRPKHDVDPKGKHSKGSAPNPRTEKADLKPSADVKKQRATVSFAKPNTGDGKKIKKSVRMVDDAPKLSSSKGKEKASKPSEKQQSSASASSPSTSSSLPKGFTIVVGSYEKLLYGIEGTFDPISNSEKPTLKPVFIFPAHVASVKAVASSPEGGRWLATGSSDEVIKIWDLRRRKEVGGLMQHQGTFDRFNFSKSFLFSSRIQQSLTRSHLSTHIRLNNIPLLSLSNPSHLRLRRRYNRTLPHS